MDSVTFRSFAQKVVSGWIVLEDVEPFFFLIMPEKLSLTYEIIISSSCIIHGFMYPVVDPDINCQMF